MTGNDDAAVLLTRRKLDVDDYHRMGEAGIFRDNERVELIEGELIDMAPIGWDHAAGVNGLAASLFAACGTRALVSVQNPVRLDRFSEPLPDFAVFRPRADNYRGSGTPGPQDVLLLVEVADSSLRVDRGVKLPLYARAGIAELWIVDLQRRVLDAYRAPSGDAYTVTSTHRDGDRVPLAMTPEIVVALHRVFD